MKHPGIMAVYAIFLLTACNQAGKPEEENKKESTEKPAVNQDRECYAWVSGRDSVSFNLEHGTTGVRNGWLVYSWAEKDRNEGSWKGTIDEDILAGWYTFQSEGRLSVRQVAWKVVGNALWPASGPVKQQQDTTYFADPVHLQYDSIQAWRKVSCTE